MTFTALGFIEGQVIGILILVAVYLGLKISRDFFS